MIKEKFILAAGSPSFSRRVVAFFQGEGWQVKTITKKSDALRYLNEKSDTPQYIVIDQLKDWTVRLARELQPQGTQVILSGFMRGTPKELEGILGVPYYSIMGPPSKVANVLLEKEFLD